MINLAPAPQIRGVKNLCQSVQEVYPVRAGMDQKTLFVARCVPDDPGLNNCDQDGKRSLAVSQ